MFDSAAYGAHTARWQRALHRGPMSWLERFLVRRSLARRYRRLGLTRPVGVFVSSPFAAAIAAGVAAGVRWLQRHPETHPRLLGTVSVSDAIRATVEAAASSLVPAVDVRGIIAAIDAVTARPAGLLPSFARTASRPVETLETVPAIAASDGRLDGLLLAEPIERARDVELAEIGREVPPPFIAVVPQRADDIVGRIHCCETFLGRVLAVWLGTRPTTASFLPSVVFAACATCGRDANDVVRIVRHTGRLFAHAEFWIAADRPTTMVTDREGRLHHIDGPAVAWRDGAGLGFLHGIPIDMSFLTRPLTLADVVNASNAELRRTLIELYERGDPGRFIRDADADVIEFDIDRLGNRRRLLRFALAGDEPYVAVEVTNSTPEPDGTQKRYILRVPPDVRSCREAVAWTFGMTAAEYDPDIET